MLHIFRKDRQHSDLSTKNEYIFYTKAKIPEWLKTQ